MEKQNKIIVICAPSGSGKTSIYKGVMKLLPIIDCPISATTRDIRGTEKNGIDYYFLSVDSFKQKIKNNEFVEWEVVYRDQKGAEKYYGTLKSEIDRINYIGKVPILDIDVKGAQSIKNIYGSNALLIYVKTPIEEIKKRLENRGTESFDQIQTRLKRLPEELTYEDKCDAVVVNIDLNKAINDCSEIIKKFLDLNS